jgi:hypothetical protein
VGYTEDGVICLPPNPPKGGLKRGNKQIFTPLLRLRVAATAFGRRSRLRPSVVEADLRPAKTADEDVGARQGGRGAETIDTILLLPLQRTP